MKKTLTKIPCTITLIVQEVCPVEYEGRVIDHEQYSVRLHLADGSSIDARISRTDREKILLNLPTEATKGL